MFRYGPSAASGRLSCLDHSGALWIPSAGTVVLTPSGPLTSLAGSRVPPSCRSAESHSQRRPPSPSAGLHDQPGRSMEEHQSPPGMLKPCRCQTDDGHSLSPTELYSDRKGEKFLVYSASSSGPGKCSMLEMKCAWVNMIRSTCKLCRL